MNQLISKLEVSPFSAGLITYQNKARWTSSEAGHLLFLAVITQIVPERRDSVSAKGGDQGVRNSHCCAVGTSEDQRLGCAALDVSVKYA